jgi:anti-anti-sigma regulatory factor
VAAAPTVIVDLGAVTFIDVRGLRVILRAAESRNGLGPLMLVNADRVDWLLELVGLGKISSIVLCDGNDAHGG